MKFSYNWLKEISKTNKNPQELIDLVMLRGFELEESFKLEEQYKGFVVGKVREVKKYPDADRLNIAKVDLGRYGRDIQVVCGAPNLKVGQKVPVAMPGAILPNSKIEIKKSKVRGVESSGMICAEDEIGLGKNHEGIMILDKTLKVGLDLAKALKLEDTVLDFDILPNRAHDCLSYQGLAREIVAMEKRNTDLNTDLNTDFSKIGELLKIEIENKELCPRYMGAVLKNIKLKESPDWLKARLIASGMEPINNVVDITNYAMLETGSPLHAFDFNQVVKEGQVDILVRKAKQGEQLELLGDDNLELDEEDLLITIGGEGVALAGIKGGKKSGISSKTNQIVLEAANFDLLTIRRSRQRHALVTESQSRFEKGISPFLAEVALERAIELLQEYAGAELVEIVDPEKLNRKVQVVDFDIEAQTKLLGEKVEEKEAFEILENLGFKIESNKVQVPYWRLDIEGQFDFSEEIGRIKGYENIKPKYLMTPIKPSKRNLLREFEWIAKDNFTAVGFDEIISYSFYGHQDVQQGKIEGKHFELENPNNNQQTLMRRTLLPGAIQAGALNQKSFDDFSLFEVGRVYLPEKEKYEELRLAGVYFKDDFKTVENFYQAKGSVKSFLKKILMTEIKFKFAEKLENQFYHPVRTAQILVAGEKIGSLGELNPIVASKNKIKKPFVIFEIDFDKLFEIKKEKVIFKKISKFPLVARDLAIFVDIKTEVDQVKEVIKKTGGKNLEEIKLFDIFKEEKKNKKSFAFHLKFSDPQKTLSGEEVEAKIETIIKAVENNDWEVRK